MAKITKEQLDAQTQAAEKLLPKETEKKETKILENLSANEQLIIIENAESDRNEKWQAYKNAEKSLATYTARLFCETVRRSVKAKQDYISAYEKTLAIGDTTKRAHKLFCKLSELAYAKWVKTIEFKKNGEIKAVYYEAISKGDCITLENIELLYKALTEYGAKVRKTANFLHGEIEKFTENALPAATSDATIDIDAKKAIA